MVRGKVELVSIPKVSNKTTEKMRTLHRLYGSARYTDVQIAYFFILWKGNHTQAALDLGCSPMTMWFRVHQLSNSTMPGLADVFGAQKIRKQRSDVKVSDEDFIVAFNASKTIRQAARILNLYPNAVRSRAKKLGLKFKGKVGRPKK